MNFSKIFLTISAGIALMLGTMVASSEINATVNNTNLENDTTNTSFLLDKPIQEQLNEQYESILKIAAENDLIVEDAPFDEVQYPSLLTVAENEIKKTEQLKQTYVASLDEFSKTLENYNSTMAYGLENATVSLTNQTVSDLKDIGISINGIYSHLSTCKDDDETDLSNVTLAEIRFKGANEIFTSSIVSLYQNFHANITKNENEENQGIIIGMVSGLIDNLLSTLDVCKKIYQSNRLAKIPQYFNASYERGLYFSPLFGNYESETAEPFSYDDVDANVDQDLDFENPAPTQPN